MAPKGFEYRTPLQQGEIRLLMLQPGQVDTPIQCSYSIGYPGKASYAALSYCWGTQPADRHILCDGQPFLVRENLFLALQHFRHPERTVVMWVDAICINQEDLDEKGQQVAFMPTIYRASSEVLVWLGVDEVIANEAVPLIRDVCANMAAIGGVTNLQWYLDARGHNVAEVLREFRLPKKADLHWHSVCALLEHPYWTRLWIVQEVLLATRPIIHCGSHSLRLEDLEDVARAIVRFRISRMSIFDDHDGILRLGVLRLRRIRNRDLSLLDLLQYTGIFEATVPVDRLFTLYGLTGSEADGGIGLAPDYKTDREEVFRKASVGMLRHSTTLHLVALACSITNADPSLPSWSPDLQKISNGLLLPLLYTDDNISSPATRVFTSRHFTAELRGNCALRVLGTELDVIVTAGDSLPNFPEVTGYSLGSMMKRLSRLPRMESIVVDWMDMALRGRWDDKDVRVARLQELFLAFRVGCEPQDLDPRWMEFAHWFRMMWMRSWVLRLHLYRIHWTLAFAVGWVVQYVCGLLGLFDYPLMRAAEFVYIKRRRLCVTARGHLVLAPGRAQPGDLVVLTQGWHKPFIMRRVEDGRTDEMVAIGECCMPALAQMSIVDTPQEIWLV